MRLIPAHVPSNGHRPRHDRTPRAPARRTSPRRALRTGHRRLACGFACRGGLGAGRITVRDSTDPLTDARPPCCPAVRLSGCRCLRVLRPRKMQINARRKPNPCASELGRTVPAGRYRSSGSGTERRCTQNRQGGDRHEDRRVPVGQRRSVSQEVGLKSRTKARMCQDFCPCKPTRRRDLVAPAQERRCWVPGWGYLRWI